MNFELSADESFAVNVHRIARASLDHVQATLSGGEAGACPAPEAVHVARKELKKLRALLRLARGGLGDSTFERENVCYRDAGRALSAARDAAVLVQAFDALRPKLYGLVAPETMAAIHDRLQAAVQESEARIDLPAAIAELRAARERVEDWAWMEGEDAWRVPGRGVRDVYRRGRRAMRRASAAEPVETDFHEWRKQVKGLAAQMRLLCPIQPDELESAAKKADSIAEWLGEEHDLSVLDSTLFGGPEGHLEATAELETIRRFLDARRQTLQKKALKHGRRLYQEKPARFAARLKAYWKRWKERKG